MAAIKYGNLRPKGQYEMDGNYWNFNGYDDPRVQYVIKLPEPINLNKNYQSIDDFTNIGAAYLIPQDFSTFSSSCYWEPVYEEGTKGPDGKSPSDAPYLALLCHISGSEDSGFSSPDATKFPFKDAYKVEYIDGVEYGWAYIPLNMSSTSNGNNAKLTKWEQGNLYTYYLDLSNGAGYNADGNLIFKGKIRFSASVKEWAHNDIFWSNGNASLEEGQSSTTE